MPVSICYRISILLLGSLLAVVAGAPSAARAGQPPPANGQQTALLVSATNAPLGVLGSDGMEHLEYDLIFTNVFTAPLTLTAIEVIAPDGHTLLRLSGDALTANTEPLFFGTLDSPVNAAPIAQIPVAGVVAAVIDLVVPPGAVPARISHTISYTLPADTPALSLIAGRTVSGPELVVDPRQPIVIAPPVHGNGWLNGNGCCMAHSVHRSPRLVIDGARYIKPETFAIDWARIQDGQLNTGDGSQNEQHFAEGAEIVSVADGTVVSVRDGLPEQTPNQPPVGIEQSGDYVGNNVVVQILPDVYAIYAHLQPGSIAVQVGERVTSGELLGRLGNSGNSSEPHLHFQLSDGPDALTSTSLPFVFDRYTLAGTLDLAAAEAALADPTAPGELTTVGTPQAQTGTYPLVLTVQDYR
jgi:Peptidase family M23